MRVAKTVGLVLLAVWFAAGAFACAGGEPQEPPPEESDLVLTEDAESVAGSLATPEGDIEFESVALGDDVFDVTLVLDDLVLKLVVDYPNSAAEGDGFDAATGADAALTPHHRALLEVLSQRLAAVDLGQSEAVPRRDAGVIKRPGVVLLRALSQWARLSDSAPLPRSLKWDNGRTVDTLCGAVSGMGVYGSHDCWDCWDYGDCYNWINIGPTPDWSTGKPGPNTQVCYTDANNCSRNTNGQGNGLWQYGDYYGRCDLSDIGQKYTADCVRHDHCVRNDHVAASAYCDDEDGTGALDDVVGYFDCKNVNGCSGKCGGAGANGCWCDEGCATYGDCCADKLAYCGGAY